MNIPSSRRLHNWHLAMLLLICVSWGLKGLNVLLVQHYRKALVEHQKPMVLNGLQLDIPQSAMKPFIFPNLLNVVPGRRYILFLSADTCSASLRQERAWAELLARLPLKAGDTALFLSTSGGEISNRLARIAAAHGIEHRTALVTDMPRFGQATGLNWTPEVAALDAELRVRVASPSATAAFVEEVVEFFGDNKSASGFTAREGDER